MAYSKPASVLLGILTALTFISSSVFASQHQCTAAKVGATAKKAFKKLKCHATAAGQGATVDAGCLTDEEAKFGASFTKAETNPPCFATGDEAAIEAKVDAFVDDMAMTLRPVSTESTCASKKLAAAGKKAFKKLTCHKKAVNKGITPDPECLSDEDARLITTFAAAEGLGDCLTMGDTAAIGADVDAFVSDAATDLRPVTPTQCSPRKVDAAGQKVRDKLRCYETAIHKGLTVNAMCLTDAETRFSSEFASAESQGDCFTLGDEAAVEATVDAFVDDVATDLAPGLPGASAPSLCSSRKLKETSQKTVRKLDCHRSVYSQGLPLDPECLSIAEVDFGVGFAASEGKGDCLAPTGDAVAIEAKVDAFVTDIVTDLLP